MPLLKTLQAKAREKLKKEWFDKTESESPFVVLDKIIASTIKEFGESQMKNIDKHLEELGNTPINVAIYAHMNERQIAAIAYLQGQKDLKEFIRSLTETV
mgnify:CR=1 FL=1